MGRNHISKKQFEKNSWYRLSFDETLERLASTKQGLNEIDVKIRYEKFGPNVIKTENKKSPILLFVEQFFSLLVIILILASVASAFVGQIVEAVTIIVIVILAGLLGFVQEYQADKAIESLKEMTAPFAKVLRGGKEKIIPASEIVPGDVILLQTGDKVPADARILHSKNLRINESALTGESQPVEKFAGIIDKTLTNAGDMNNLVFMGTSVSYGRGKAVVIGTGQNTEFGKIALMLKETERRKTPLQKNLDKLGRKLGVYSIILASLMSLLGIFEGYDIIRMFVWGVAVAVAVIPEALPAVVTISIALGVRRMVKRKALIRKLPAVETLGAINFICTDKTGTLTKDQMTVKKIFAGGKILEVTGDGYDVNGSVLEKGKKVNLPDKHYLKMLLNCGILCNDSTLTLQGKHTEIIGDPTEAALLVVAEKAGINYKKLRAQNIRLDEIPFSSETKRMTTLNKTNEGNIAFTKGALEIIISNSSKIFLEGREVEFTDEMKKKVVQISEKWASQAFRILGMAFKKIQSNNLNEDCQKHMTFLGFVGMIDPPRIEALEAIRVCEKASIKPVMITGDHKTTAVAIAKKLGILKKGRIIEGSQIEKFSDEEFNDIVEKTEVYARISPAHKLKIVNALMEKGNIVAMTGDGVNDAPALKRADIGIAMGIKGTEVSREAADMILTDDNFATIVAAIEEGRSIFENIRKYLVYLLSGNLGAVIALVVALLVALPLPLAAVQILFINFFMDGLIAIALGVEKPEKIIMRKKPRRVEEGIINLSALSNILVIGLWIGIVSLGVFVWGLKCGLKGNAAMTLFFITLIFARLFNGINCRSFILPFFKIDLFSNKSLLIGIAVSLISTFVVITLPPLQVAFRTSFLSPKFILVAFLASASILIVGEFSKKVILKLSKD